MKREIRSKLTVLSATAAVLTMTSLFSGCSGKQTGDGDTSANTLKVSDMPYQIVNDENLAQLEANKSNIGSTSNAGSFSYAISKEDKDKLLTGAKDTHSILFNNFRIYKTEDGKYFIINKNEAYNLIEKNGEYHVLEKEDDHFVLTSEQGFRTIVFGGDKALADFTKMLEDKLKEAKESEKVYTVVNGIYIGDPVESMEVTRYDGTRKYYDFESLMSVVSKAVEELGYVNPISYEKAKDEKSITIKRTSYKTNKDGYCTEEAEVELVLPVGDEGEVYYDNNMNSLFGMTFKKDGKFWVCQDALLDIVGIDAFEGEYTVPGTNTSAKVLSVDTNAGMDTPEFVTDPTVKKSEESDNEVTIMDQSAFDQEFNGGQVSGNVSSGDNESYDQQAYENLGIKVYLHGTNEEQAQQWADALNEAYPNLNMTCNGNASGPAIPPNEDKYTMSPEEIDAKIMEALGGKDWHDCNIGELANAIPWCGGTELGMEISLYFGEQTARSFNWGDYHIIG